MEKLIEVSASPLVMSLLTGLPLEKALPWLFGGFVVWVAFKHGKK